MSNTGLFGWIRDGVKHSVLMGVSDAMEVIGTPNDPGQYHPALQSLAQGSAQRITGQSSESASPRAAIGEPVSKRKRLGRSLKDITPTPSAPTKPAS
jgi:hypothetical protein